MEITLADQYYLKAFEAYPWNIAEVIENLNYALSYKDDHAQAWCLHGMIHMYNLKNYKKAQESFNNALEADLIYVDTYKHLTLLKIWRGQLKEAHKIIDYAIKVEAIDKSTILGLKALLMEVQGKYEQADEILKTARLLCLDCSTLTWLKEVSKRIDTKKKDYKNMMKQSKRKSGKES